MPSSYSYCTSCIVIRYFNNITGSKKNFDCLRGKTFGISPFAFLKLSKMQLALALLLTLFLSHGEAGILRGHRNRADRGGSSVSSNRHYQSGAEVPGSYCGTCDIRNCPLVSAETCRGQVVKDRCGCCPFCDTLKPEKSLVSTENSSQAKAACKDIQCPRSKICLLNIQNIPFCRCPSAYFCRRQHVKGYWKDGDSHLCGRDGKTYRNRCLLQVAECASSRKIRVAYKGKCLTDTPNKKKKGGKKSNSKSVSNSNGYDGAGNSPMTQVISQYPSNQGQYSSNRDKHHPSNRDKSSPGNRDRDGGNSNKGKQGTGRRQKHHKIKENRRQRRKDRINRRTKRRYKIYWLD